MQSDGRDQYFMRPFGCELLKVDCAAPHFSTHARCMAITCGAGTQGLAPQASIFTIGHMTRLCGTPRATGLCVVKLSWRLLPQQDRWVRANIVRKKQSASGATPSRRRCSWVVRKPDRLAERPPRRCSPSPLSSLAGRADGEPAGHGQPEVAPADAVTAMLNGPARSTDGAVPVSLTIHHV